MALPMFFHGIPSAIGLPSIRRPSRNRAMNWASLMPAANGFSGGAGGANELLGTPSSWVPWQSAQPPTDEIRYLPYAAVGPAGGAATAARGRLRTGGEHARAQEERGQHIEAARRLRVIHRGLCAQVGHQRLHIGVAEVAVRLRRHDDQRPATVVDAFPDRTHDLAVRPAFQRSAGRQVGGIHRTEGRPAGDEVLGAAAQRRLLRRRVAVGAAPGQLRATGDLLGRARHLEIGDRVGVTRPPA